MKRIHVAVLAAAMLFSWQHSQAATKPAPAHQLRLALNGETIEINRATPGATVLVLGYEWFIRDFEPVYRRVQREGTADTNGLVTVGIGHPVALSSFWVAFDLETGGHGAIGGTKLALREGELPIDSLSNGPNGKKTRLGASVDYIYSITIRPKTGVWELTVGDGGESDDDRAFNGRIETRADHFRKTKHAHIELDEFEEDDVVAVLVPHQMGYLVTKVKK
jgi:hypothetical protein